MKRWIAAFAAATVLFVGTFSRAQDKAATDPNLAPNPAISGTMDIQFNTRTNLDQSGDLKANSPAIGAKDQYNTNLTVNKFVNFTGAIQRQPNLFSKVIGKKKQAAELYYNLTINVVNPRDPSQHRAIGKWVGQVPINTDTGAYVFAGGAANESPCRFDVDSVGSIRAYKDYFQGNLVGKAEKKDNLAAYTYKRLVGGKEVSITVKRSDPMRFENLALAKGPSDNYGRAVVNGRLDYDYETGNYFTDGLRVSYNDNGTDVTDVITGSIKWVEDPQRKVNGKGHYEFNLRWNEDKQAKKGDESAAFKNLSQEDAFFAVDNTIPCLTGNIDYVDTMNGDTVTASKVSYNLSANRLTKQQVMTFTKLWLVAIGPTNDE